MEEEKGGLEELIEAFKIFLKYGNPTYPTVCEHDVMYIVAIDPSDVSEKDKVKLEELGFFIDSDLNQFASYKFGSA